MTDTATTPPTRTRWHSTTVSEVCRAAPDAVAVTLEVPAGLREVFAHQPGRHVVVRHRRADGELRRAYSLCPPPHDPSALRLVIKRGAPDGFGAHAVSGLAPGDRLELSAPVGNFALAGPPGAHHVLIAGGSGITPLAALAADALRRDAVCRVSLVHSVPNAAHALLADEVAALKDMFLDRFTVQYVLTRDEQDPDAPFRGRIDADQLSRLLTVLGVRRGEDTAYALCGPPGMLATVRRFLDGRGVDPALVRWESFMSGSPAPSVGTTRPAPAVGPMGVTALFDGHRVRAALGPQDSVILDALLRAHPDVPYACREGVCGSCRAKVVSGRVRAERQHALDDRDRAEGYTLVCRARPDSAEVVIDFDA
ncbi:phenylacetic acid degradation protein [Streptomyces sp. NBRC 14336]|uniref:2Fe-2S iron-sulfur cluster-binding protein n=1 Tax=Streptomyces sp. NBRC 14336 TaxID=3030992 RepID=UPI0024A28EC1|nr:2Fe-2S iron-sulfur cluster-binding protein [Streptomyces sp. NBRC 14336]GLW49462.1 phenylacetic acid degradation protein [Streptomyces sp. NBRC 14336]